MSGERIRQIRLNPHQRDTPLSQIDVHWKKHDTADVFDFRDVAGKTQQHIRYFSARLGDQHRVAVANLITPRAGTKLLNSLERTLNQCRTLTHRLRICRAGVNDKNDNQSQKKNYYTSHVAPMVLNI